MKSLLTPFIFFLAVQPLLAQTKGQISATSTGSPAIQGTTVATDGTAVFGWATGAGNTIGVRGLGVTGGNFEGSDEGLFAVGQTGVDGYSGTQGGVGVAGTGSTGVSGFAFSNGTGVWGGTIGGGVSVWGQTGTGMAIYGDNGTSNTTGYAGYFNGRVAFLGNVAVLGTLSKAAGSFKIDHPLDPDNKYLSHSFVESPDMKNIYDGIVVLDHRGEAVVVLPDWFEALNRDFRYQLTCLGGAAQVFIATEIRNNTFVIGGGYEGLKVSWQVTGIRHDRYADAHRIPVEEEKPAAEKGRYLHPDLYEKQPDKAVYGTPAAQRRRVHLK